MYAFDRMCRVILVGLLAAACAALAAFPAAAQTHATKAKATALPEPLTHESVRELVSRLSDEEVRRLLLDQLDRAAAPANAIVFHRSGLSGDRAAARRNLSCGG